MRSNMMWLIVVQPLHGGSPICSAVLIISFFMITLILNLEDIVLRSTASASRGIELVIIRSVVVKEDDGCNWAKPAT